MTIFGKVKPHRGTLEIEANSVKILGTCLYSEYPLQQATFDPDTARKYPHLRLRGDTFRSMFKVRSHLASSFRKILSVRAFDHSKIM